MGELVALAGRRVGPPLDTSAVTAFAAELGELVRRVKADPRSFSAELHGEALDLVGGKWQEAELVDGVLFVRPSPAMRGFADKLRAFLGEVA